MKYPAPICYLALLFILCSAFNLDNAIVPKEEIQSGGVPRDGIPAILEPRFIRPDQADYLEPETRRPNSCIQRQTTVCPSLDRGPSASSPSGTLNTGDLVGIEIRGRAISSVH